MIFDPTAGDGSTLTTFDVAKPLLTPQERQYIAAKRAAYIEREQEKSLRDTNILMRSNRNRSFS